MSREEIGDANATHTASLLALALVLAVGFAITSGGPFVAAQEATTMAIQETETALQAYADALLGGGTYETFFADDVVLTVVGAGMETRGPGAAKQAIDALHTEQFDAAPEITNVIVGAGTAALEIDFIGTHTGEFAGIAATGAEVNVPYSVFYELADGKITALRIYALADGLVQQIQAAS